MNRQIALTLCMLTSIFTYAQPNRWQQRVKYTMDVKMDVNTNRFTGTQKLEYSNNSPDTLGKVFYHLYWNAFQPGSMMDERSRRQGSVMIRGGRGESPDWDGRVRDRIANLKPDEMGYQKVTNLLMNGRQQKLIEHETILEVVLDKPILPKSKVTFELQFESQVPLQVRRSGRDNAEGIRYSMSQWYPKLCEYDYEGWHPNPYVGREFYGVWGDFDVKITIEKSYIIASSGYLQNPNQIGYGYESAGAKVVRPAGANLTWHFIAPNVHDFMWAADPEYKHVTKTVRNGLVLHAFYKISAPHLQKAYEALPQNVKGRYKDVTAYMADYENQWKNVLPEAERALPFIEKTFGPYAYKQYSFVHGGDGGMEYAMATLLKGPSIGTVIHEWMHSWYQMMLGTNESLYAWMDEGFTSYAESRITAWLRKSNEWPYADDYAGYFFLARSGREEPMTTHADHFNSNFAYSLAAYSKGCIFIEQLGYIVGAEVRDRILRNYYWQWRFKHPNANDFIVLAEKETGMKLDWYKEYWVNTTKTIDYAIDSLWEENGVSKIRMKNIGLMPMPIDVQLTFKDSTTESHYVPMNLMYGSKPVENSSVSRKNYSAWKWTSPTYVIETTRKLTDLRIAEIDPSQRMADIDRKNNRLELTW
ncbi:MAG TPA: M1 family metallopeptidase [Chitinophagaceae bacterium]|nr:M1 family metallopeptidase [Chitinophagaceae bacterium]